MIEKMIDTLLFLQYNLERDCTLSLAKSDICLGKLYAAQNDSTKALKFFRKAYSARSMYLSRKRSPEIAECWLCVGKVYESFGEYENALTCYDEVLSIKCNLNHYHDILNSSETAIKPDPEILSLERQIKELEDKCYPDEE